jgi:hypothetical protein
VAIGSPPEPTGVSSSHVLLIEHTVAEDVPTGFRSKREHSSGRLSPSVDTAVIRKRVSTQGDRTYAVISGRHGEDCT